MIGRRAFLTGTAAGGFAALTPRSAAADPSPETGTIRVSSSVAICTAPQLVSEDLLRAEGFAVVQHGRQATIGTLEEVAAGQVDIGIVSSVPRLSRSTAGRRSRSWPGFTRGASSCSEPIACAHSRT
jgi:DNA-binding transcriptional LysR family regulator